MFPAEIQAMVSFMRDSAITGQRLKRGTVRRMLRYARPYRRGDTNRTQHPGPRLLDAADRPLLRDGTA